VEAKAKEAGKLNSNRNRQLNRIKIQLALAGRCCLLFAFVFANSI
jgi:hypothetical protein